MAPRRYLVTGGLGFIGSALVRRLVAGGNSVRVFDNGSRGAARRLGELIHDVELLHGDIRDPRLVREAVQGVDSICHLAFVNGTRYFYEKPAYVLDVGVKGMVNVLDAAMQYGVRDLILVSSSEVYQTPPETPTNESVPLNIPDVLNPRYSYAGGKIISELMAINYGREHFERVAIVRPHNVFGPDMGWEHVIPEFATRMAKAADTRDEAIPFSIQGAGEQTRAFIYIDDFIEGMVHVIERGSHLNIYHVGTEEELRIRDVAERIARILGLKIEIVQGAEAEGATRRRCPAIGKLRALGFKAQWTFDDALRVTVDWYRQNAPVGPE